MPKRIDYETAERGNMEQPANVIITGEPNLRRPAMVCGIGGWVDGGEAATGSVEYLIRKLSAKQFAEIPIDRFHIFQVPGQIASRPQVKIEDGIITEHSFHSNQFYYLINAGSDSDLILFLGTEPNLHWTEFADAILHVVQKFDVSRIYLLGGVLDKTPHTREPNVSCACTTSELKEEMLKYSVRYTSYEGPSRFGTTLLYICQQRGIEMVSLTARATYYPEFSIVISHNPKTIRAIVRRLDGLLQLNLDVSDLDQDVAEFEKRLGAIASRSADFRSYLENLEKDYVEVKYEEPLELSGDEAVRIAEDLLRGRSE
jgi:proteasome assembly chaperone (PAC2) family protein